jgi:hypothetical protein
VVLDLVQEITVVLSVDDLAGGLAGEHYLADLMRLLPQGGPGTS